MNIIRKVLNKIWSNGYKKSYAQCGEDIIVEVLLHEETSGFYIDIGSNNPTKQSNTKLFYNKGWRGINIDPLPGSKEVFDKLRPNDMNIQTAISDKRENLSYYMFKPSLYNSFNKETVNYHKDKYIGKTTISTIKLEDLLNNYDIPSVLSFISIDVEGMEINVLKSNNWHKYKPIIVIIEKIFNKSTKIYDSLTYKYLIRLNYSVAAITPTNVIYIDKSYNKNKYDVI